MNLKHYLLIAALTLMGCAGTNPVKPAIDSGKPELIAYALEGSYTIVQGKALEVAKDPATPQEVRNVLADIDAKANPLLDSARPLATEAEAIRKEVETCGGASECDTKEAKLASLLTQLNGILTRVSPLINDLIAAIKGGAQ